MTRVISGRWGGRRLTVPTGDGTRPTSDRVRESMFASLNSLLGGFDGLRVLDLYAGSGALGLEALSRGAEHADLVESYAKAARTIARNVKELGAPATVHTVAAQRFVDEESGPWDLVFLDPPYAVPSVEVASLLTALRPHLNPDAVVVVERAKRDPFAWPEGFDALRDKAYGDTRLWYGH
ncbi:DNA methylase [Aeromicrobium flavum]|uniref:DNA methylase n=1 Tax=Aeromicrobium flavum TaxID=416568 RepID=A0A512HVM8_9ACTN|nr:16S rRNA (guanine(966)-N(2))-methyltransferase RsmD [Aeromicrobium flavum]GEO89504.1 DNA methylase [Aeromicrobium flavum]